MNQRRAFVLLTVAVSSLLALLVLLPFVEYIIASVLLGYVLYPFKDLLEPYTGEKVASFIPIVFALFLIVAPILIVSIVVVQDAVELTRNIDATTFDFTPVEQLVYEYTGEELNITEQVSSVGQRIGNVLVGSLSQVFGLVSRVLLGTTLFVFLLYYVLKDGEDFVAWSKDVSPLPPDITGRLYERLGEMTHAVVYGHLFVAVVQAILTGAALVAVGLPNPLFWSFVMLFLAVLPIVGVFLVWGPASVYLVATGEVVAGVALALYGATIVSVSDNLLRSYLVDRDTGLNPGVVLIGVLGGIYAMGIIGLFIGPVILGAFKATLAVYKNNYESL
ncbi:MAG: AI-2E family transporter [Halobacteriales archaeon]